METAAREPSVTTRMSGKRTEPSSTIAHSSEELHADHSSSGTDIPLSPNVLHMVHIVAPTLINVLIEKGSKTERVLVAETVHNLSDRRGGPFIKVDCVEHSSESFAAELFAVPGIERRHRKTCFERARHGTLFLNDVGAIPRSMQRRLLHILQNREIATDIDYWSHRIDIRLIAASERPLADLVSKSGFNEELYNMLKVFSIEMQDR